MLTVNLSTKIDCDEAFVAWLERGALAGANSLVLWNGRLTDAAARALAVHPDAASLRSLDLSWNRIGPDGARALADGLPGLVSLRLYHNDVGPRGTVAVANARWRLTSLNLCGNGIGVEGAAALARGEATERLESLHLGWVGLGDRGVARLAERRWRLLRELNVRDNEITMAGARTLISDAFPKLRRLGLDDNPLGVEALPVLRSPAARRIESINLAGCDVEGRVG